MPILWQPSTFEEVDQCRFQHGVAGVPIIDVMNFGFEYNIDLKASGFAPQDIHPFGTMKFILYGLTKEWNISFSGHEFSYITAMQRYGDLFLNADAEVLPLERIKLKDRRFIRHASAFNRISGQVFDPHRWNQFVRRELGETRNYIYIHNDSICVVAQPKQIDSEYRVFVIDGKPVSASLYLLEGAICIQNRDYHNPLLIFANECIERYSPHANFVLDIAVVNGEFKVLELNCVHCSDFYACNIEEIMSCYVATMGVV